ncbi:LysM domain-containing protein [Colletotrichum sublineola]|nr:LysM domain-containing protein [Colletotrichum sublineola]
MQISAIFSVLAVVGAVAAAPTGTGCDVCPGPTVKYIVQSGDTLTRIADALESGICDIAMLSNLADPNSIGLNQTLLVPTSLCEPDNTSCLTKPGTAQCVQKAPSTWTVQEGQTFFIIASKLGLDVKALEAANPNVKADDIAIGQVLQVPVCK